MTRIKGTPIRSKKNKPEENKPTKVHYNGISGSVRICIAADGGLKSGDLVYQEKLDNGIILIIPESVYDNTRSN